MEEPKSSRNLQINRKCIFCKLWSFIHPNCSTFFFWLLAINLTISLVYVVIHRNGEPIKLIHSEKPLRYLDVWKPICWKRWYFPVFLIIHLIWSCVSQYLIPGEQYNGPFALSGYQPHYKSNGSKFYIISMAYILPLIVYFPMVIVYQSLVTLVAYLILLSFIVSIILTIKGHYGPSPGVFKSTGSLWKDFLEGIELYPRLFDNKVDCKILILSRFSYFLWQIIILIAGKVNYELYSTSYQRGQINISLWIVIFLQTIYIKKHFFCGKGFIGSIDMSQSKLGFNQCYRAIVWTPIINSLGAIYLVKHGPPMEVFGISHGCIVLSLGFICIKLLDHTDFQKYIARSSHGQRGLWPFKLDKALQVTYLDEDSLPQKTILLTSGFWSLVRHPNYTLELTIAILWSIPVWSTNPIIYIYPGYLFIYLINRINWIDDECSSKYGQQWEKYRQLVPYRLIPYFY